MAWHRGVSKLRLEHRGWYSTSVSKKDTMYIRSKAVLHTVDVATKLVQQYSCGPSQPPTYGMKCCPLGCMFTPDVPKQYMWIRAAHILPQRCVGTYKGMELNCVKHRSKHQAWSGKSKGTTEPSGHLFKEFWMIQTEIWAKRNACACQCSPWTQP